MCLKMPAIVRINRPHKYRARRTEYNGQWYDSAAEARFAALLDMRVRVGEIRGWERQKVLPLTVNGVVVCKMIVDFVVTHNDYSLEHIEVKGVPTKDWVIKRNLFRALWPAVKYTVIQAKSI